MWGRGDDDFPGRISIMENTTEKAAPFLEQRARIRSALKATAYYDHWHDIIRDVYCAIRPHSQSIGR